MGICTEYAAGTALVKQNIVNDISALTCPPGTGNCCGNSKIPMGLGALGNGLAIYKRKFRYTFEIEYCCASGGKQVASSFIKTASRPNIDIDEVEINYLNGVTWIPGKGKWQTMTVTYYDVASSTGNLGAVSTLGLLGWLASVYDFTDPVCLPMGGALQDYEGLARITLYDGCGNPLEAWILQHCWPKAINFGELDMGSSDECTIEITLRYSQVSFVNYCPGGTLDVCPCTGCPGS